MDSDIDIIQVIIKEDNIIFKIASGPMFVISIIEFNYRCLEDWPINIFSSELICLKIKLFKSLIEIEIKENLYKSVLEIGSLKKALVNLVFLSDLIESKRALFRLHLTREKILGF